jgi:hypothetical protein
MDVVCHWDTISLRRLNKLPMRILAKAIIPLGLALLCSCATHNSHSSALHTPELPPEQILGEKAGAEGLLIVTLRLSDGQTLPCVVDTGASYTMLDQSLQSSLTGPRLQSEQLNTPFYEEGHPKYGVYAAPKVYLGNVPLMSGPTILVGPVFDTNICPYKAILGMDCLRHYCIQLDFDEHKLRFLDSNKLKREELGLAFPVNFTTNRGGVPLVDIKWATNRNVRLMVDTGFRSPDFSLPSGVVGPAIQSHGAVDSLTGTYIRNTLIETFLFPTVTIGPETYKNVRFLQHYGAGGEIDGFMGLPFLARHKVTFDFPNNKMYLRLRHPETGK